MRILTVTLLFLLFITPVHANESEIIDINPEKSGSLLITDINASRKNTLIEKMKQHRLSLTQERTRLQEYLKTNPLGTKDAVITVLLPGGLLYAAHRKNKIDTAKKRLKEIDTQIREINNDMTKLTSDEAPEKSTISTSPDDRQ